MRDSIRDSFIDNYNPSDLLPPELQLSELEKFISKNDNFIGKYFSNCYKNNIIKCLLFLYVNIYLR